MLQQTLRSNPDEYQSQYLCFASHMNVHKNDILADKYFCLSSILLLSLISDDHTGDF